MPSTHPLPAAIRKGLHEHADPVRAPEMQAYMKSEMPYLGVSTPNQRPIYRDAWKLHPVKDIEEYEFVIRNLWENAQFREERYAALNVSKKYEKFIVLEMLPLYQEMIVTGAWWDYVDTIAADLVGTLLARYPSEMKPILRKWIQHDDLWIRRSAILSQLRHKKKTDTEMLFTFCKAQLDDSTFWIRKAIGWALREYSKTDPFAVKSFVDKNKNEMSGLSMREASKYI